MSSIHEHQPHFFISTQRDLLIAVLNRIVPSEGDFPGAGDLGVAEFIDDVVGKSATLKRMFLEGLAEIEIDSDAKHSKQFIELSNDQKDSILRKIEASSPKFFNALVQQVYRGYYSNSHVITLLGLEARPPQPLGYELEPFDISLLESVKARGQIYKDV